MAKEEEVVEKKDEEVVEKKEEENLEPTLEDKASEKGWKPLEDYEGNTEEWVDAKEFLAREPLFKGLHKLNRENKKLKEALLDVKKMFNNVKDVATKQAMERLKVDFEAAAEAGNVKAAIEVKDQMDELSQDTPGNTKDNSEAKQEVYQTWLNKNEWFDNDPRLRRWANGLGQELIQEKVSDRGSVEALTISDMQEIYSEVTEQVKAEFPEKFKPMSRRTTSVTETKARTGNRSSQNKLSDGKISDLPDAAIQVARNLIRQGVFTEAEYIKTYREGGGKFKGEV